MTDKAKAILIIIVGLVTVIIAWSLPVVGGFLGWYCIGPGITPWHFLWSGIGVAVGYVLCRLLRATVAAILETLE